jgi:uncharacterized protein YodC (DUF2158 family)
MSFNAGDKVQLKSGGEIMTIEDIDDSTICVLFDNKKVERHTFLSITLKIVE